MAYKDQNLIQTKDSTPGPQYYSELNDVFEALQGMAGALHVLGPRIIYNIDNGQSSVSPSNFGTGVFIGIINDGSLAITLQIESKTFTVNPGESWEGRFKPFTTFTLTTSSKYRLEVWGF